MMYADNLVMEGLSNKAVEGISFWKPDDNRFDICTAVTDVNPIDQNDSSMFMMSSILPSNLLFTAALLVCLHSFIENCWSIALSAAPEIHLWIADEIMIVTVSNTMTLL